MTASLRGLSGSHPHSPVSNGESNCSFLDARRSKSRLSNPWRDNLVSMSNSLVNVRSLAATFGICAVVILGLLLAHPHPHEPLTTFSDVVDFEIRHQTMDRIVHGSMIPILIILL